MLRGLYAGAMAALQLPAGILAERFGARGVLVAGTALAAIGYAIAGLSGGLVGLCTGLVLSGAGSSTQHPIASTAVARAYGSDARGPLGTYNFTGDLGKAAFPPLTALLLAAMSWRASLGLLAVIGLVVAAVLALLMPPIGFKASEEPAGSGPVDRNGFRILFAMGVLDSAVRMAFLTFLPFLLRAKGATLPVIGLALAAVFIGGAAGKFGCGPLGRTLGMVRTVILTEVSTAVLILCVLGLPLTGALLVMPVLGFMLNGTSSVLYGTVPELVRPHQTARAFALFYTGTIGSGALTPIFTALSATSSARNGRRSPPRSRRSRCVRWRLCSGEADGGTNNEWSLHAVSSCGAPYQQRMRLNPPGGGPFAIRQHPADAPGLLNGRLWRDMSLVRSW